jgi:hypothetical protein
VVNDSILFFVIVVTCSDLFLEYRLRAISF